MAGSVDEVGRHMFIKHRDVGAVVEGDARGAKTFVPDAVMS